MAEQSNLDEITTFLNDKFSGETEYLQATHEVLQDIVPIYNANAHYKAFDIVRRLCLAERIINFTVSWMNSEGNIEVNQGWRVQHNSAMGPYKGGLRFHPTVNLSVLKFLAFEQCFKNALTGLPMGGGKGGSDFNPKGRSDRDIMLFCRAFMRELQRHIGANTDVPAGDINVGAREIGYLYGEYRRLNNKFEGVLTGKGLEFGGSYVRTEATGFGLIYFLDAVCQYKKTDLKGKTVTVSGAGNVALHAALKAVEKGAKVISLSNSRGLLHSESGLSDKNLRWAIENHASSENILYDMAEQNMGAWVADKKPWHLKCDIALPCATQNELQEEDANALLNNGCKMVLEGANMPCTTDAQKQFFDAKITYVPGKASNAGGVALSGLEMGQNAMFNQRDASALDEQLCSIMNSIHERCVIEGKREDGHVDYMKGANIAAFRRLADAMLAQGV
ncbi:NADP-specific glutamate dehydrogenase [Alteromonas mediterranea]|uniref:NADP-specific glutamate dehydrogenase n=1 Tax=Alteromonas mediterranea TaxID=314275 RepID=UPI00035557E7|nr:NADP-specific glutamate dehydrogenase [Alteromonas mediterranea]AGP85544.1 glutamate dehydrogenase [Alteromonas mediterranea U4]AGP89672.1 glutamate dehydrogenase [Alteromonas mediterranea U7]AGP93540.1 glutamate dehydrogenase [Alteromonas mediterranea U8]